MVFFGGYDGSGASTGTFELGTAWTTVAASTPPPGSYGAAEAYDAVSGMVVVVGGYSSGPFSGAWSYSGTSWTALSTNVGARSHGNMVFDPLRAKLIHFGGFNSSTNAVSETWEY
jgi:hypothetical protein